MADMRRDFHIDLSCMKTWLIVSLILLSILVFITRQLKQSSIAKSQPIVSKIRAWELIQMILILIPIGMYVSLAYSDWQSHQDYQKANAASIIKEIMKILVPALTYLLLNLFTISYINKYFLNDAQRQSDLKKHYAKINADSANLLNKSSSLKDDDSSSDEGDPKPLQQANPLSLCAEVKTFLWLPSMIAGICLGTNNFCLSYISDSFPHNLWLFSLGAVIFTSTYRIIMAIKNKRECGQFFPVETSNLLTYDENSKVKIKWINVFGLLARVVMTMGIHSTIAISTYLAKMAGLSPAIIGAMLSLTPLFAAIFCRIIFKEKLTTKSYVGISLILVCVGLFAYSSASGSTSNMNSSGGGIYVILMGMIPPCLVAIALTFQRYWTCNFNYVSQDMTIDVFVVQGFIEFTLFLKY